MEFVHFKTAVAKQWARMQQYPLFRTAIEKDAMWDIYLAAFPKGTNPKYRERTEHDCSCCKQFIRSIGDVVAVIDGKVESVWDIKVPQEPAYEAVAKSLGEMVRAYGIAEPFLHYERAVGTDKNFEQVIGGDPITWNHFYVNLLTQFVVPRDTIPTSLGTMRATHDVFERGLKDITMDALDTVDDLITQGSLYRGAEHKHLLTEFRKLKIRFAELSPGTDNSTFLWTAVKEVPDAVARIRNTVIGTLLVDLSEGKDLEQAVGAFENKVSGTNYKRPTALVTKGMIDKAKQKVEELGLTSALERRYAVIEDVTINNVLFADRSVKQAWMGDVFDTLAPKATPLKNLDKVEEVPIEKFLIDILPKAESVEVMLENKHTPNLVSLIAPVDPTAGDLFKWGNKFSWSYNGEVADSIKERVKKAGGNVTGDLCCRLAWHNHDDLDFHMREPGRGHIYFADKHSLSGGQLDVDMNAGMGTTREPVENIYYGDRRRMPEGNYELSVHQYNRRETDNVGFEAEIDYLGVVYNFAYAKPLRQSENVVVAKFMYSHKNGITFVESLPASQATRTVWGLPTQTFARVNVIMRSPNYWDDGGIGNMHHFFMLEGCANDGTARGFYNEFLRAGLDPHRKVFEMIGSKLKPAPAAKQLSGLGFSSTQKNTLICRVKGSFSRIIKIIF